MCKRILFLCHCLYGGGAERVLVTLANYMEESGYEVRIIASFNNGEYPLNAGVNVQYVGEGKHLKFIIASRKAIKEFHPNVVIAFEYFVNLLASIACLGTKTRLIVSERNDPALVGSGIIKDRIRNFLYRFVDVLVCQTLDAKKYFPEYIQKKTIVIANPLKPNLPPPYRGERKKEIVTFCRLRKQKNLDMLIEGFSRFLASHSGYTLKIYGDGDEKEKLVKMCISLGIERSVNFQSATKNIHEMVVDSAMFVLTSDYEGLSNSMLEAIAIGLPSICTDCPCGGARMIIKDGENGLLIPVGDINALVDAMKKVVDDPVLSESLSKAGSRLREELSIKNIGTQWLQLVEGK